MVFLFQKFLRYSAIYEIENAIIKYQQIYIIMKISKDTINKIGKFCVYNLAAAFIVCYWLYAVATGELDSKTISQIMVHPFLFFSGILLTNLLMIGIPILGFFFARFLFRLVLKLKAKRKK